MAGRIGVVAALMAAGTFAAPAQAAPLTLDLDDADVANFADGTVDDGDRAVVGPVSLTFSDVRTFNGSTGGFVDFDGIGFGREGSLVVSLGLTFGVDTVITGYDIDYNDVRNDLDTFFRISGPNGVSGLNPLTRTGVYAFDMGTIPLFLAGETYVLTHDIPAGEGASQIDEFFVTAPVPLPLPAGALLAGLGALALVRRRA